MTKDNYVILESKMNKSPHNQFEIYESIATIDEQILSEKVNKAMQFYELSIQSLAKTCNISEFRLSALLNGNSNFEKHEIDLVKKRLHIK